MSDASRAASGSKLVRVAAASLLLGATRGSSDAYEAAADGCSPVGRVPRVQLKPFYIKKIGKLQKIDSSNEIAAKTIDINPWRKDIRVAWKGWFQ